MEKHKIGAASGIGAAVLVLWAFLVPKNWEWGIPIGFLVGYVTYEFKAVLRSIPEAARKTYASTIAEMRSFFSFTHPTLYSTFLLFVGIVLYETVISHAALDIRIVTSIFAPLIWFMCSCIFLEVGQHACRVYTIEYWDTPGCIENKKYLHRDDSVYEEAPQTYANCVRWGLLGFVVSIRWIVVTLFKIVKWVAWLLCVGIIWNLIKLIHSQERLICGFAAAIGGTSTYLAFGIHAEAPVAKALTVIAGAGLGYLVGMFQWHVVSKRFFLPNEEEA